MKTLQHHATDLRKLEVDLSDAGNEARLALRRERLAHNISLQRLAAAAGISFTYLSKIERGERGVDPDLLDKLHHQLAVLVTNQSTQRVIVEDNV